MTPADASAARPPQPGARLVSAWGLSRSLGASGGRQAGAGLTLLVMLATALLLGFRLLGA